ncbi:SDR family oxidoreductase [Enemella dayhoffiae]|uniref:SDR family oxidoreductase n=1 Tax=Enemella dayhoffiae TaxID=2016507 RepID=UPI001E47D6C5|nr:SDR family oxidoreductase [Enemella dayhoffiae]
MNTVAVESAGDAGVPICAGRVTVVTGAGQGLGRAHALELARQGSRVVVNDMGGSAAETVSQIRAAGGEAVACPGDVSDWEFGAELVRTAVQTFGALDAVVNNAGINRDRMLATMSEREWDDVLRVNLKGHFVPMRHAIDYWRAEAKAGRPRAARVVNTSSGAGLMGSVGQGNYAAAKAAIAALGIVAGTEWGRYGVLVNSIAPSARTPMTEQVFAEMMARPESGFDAMDPANVSPVVAWLASERATVTGLMFEAEGGRLSIADGWRHGQAIDLGRRFEPAELDEVVGRLVASAEPPTPVYGSAG